MTTHDALQIAEAILQPIASELTRPAPERLDARVAAGDLPAAVEALRNARFGYLSAITGLDLPPSPPKAGDPSASAGQVRPSPPRAGDPSASAGQVRPSPPRAGDPAASAGQVEVLYHFCEGSAVVSLRVTVPYDAARVPTICHLIPSATLYERELAEMLGVTVEGTPVTDHLLLPESWPDGVYPLRKAFTGKLAGA